MHPRPRCLLLLPPPPSPPEAAALEAAYAAPLVSALSGAAGHAALLEIALPCPHLYGQETVPRCLLYPRTQSLVAGLYRLICVLAARHAVDVDDAEGVDARILLLAYPRDGKLGHVRADGRPEGDVQGPVIDMGTLSRSGRPWQTIYSVESEAGEQVLKNFQAGGNGTHNITKLGGGIVQVSDNDAPEPGVHEPRRHFSVAVGGTFDHLHIGHKLLLTMTAFAVDGAESAGSETERTITVGITGDELLKKKQYAEFLESWDARQQAVAAFVGAVVDFAAPGSGVRAVAEQRQPGANGHAVNVRLGGGLTVRCVEIWDAFGPTITDESISALVVSGETRAGGEAVSAKRRAKGWAGVSRFEVAVLDGPDAAAGAGFAGKLSSTARRRAASERAGGL